MSEIVAGVFMSESDADALETIEAMVQRQVAATSPDEKEDSILRPDREYAAAILRELPAPSSYSDPRGANGWDSDKSKRHGFTNLLQCHRTSSSARPLAHPLFQIPVSLLDPILAQLAEDCEFLSPSAGDCKFAVKVAHRMSEAFESEKDRLMALWPLLTEEYQVRLTRIKFSRGETETDGSLLGASGLGLVLNLEVKNEVGEGHGAIHVQNAAYAAQYAVASENKNVRERSVCPTILLEVAGPNMSISGSVFSAIGICDQLTPMVSLLFLPHSPLMMQAARCFGALRKALIALNQFYSSILERPPSPRQLEYPYPFRFTFNDGLRHEFKYLSSLSPRCFCALWGEEKIIVKFTRSYSAEAHSFLAEQGYAPKLLSVQPLAGRWQMVVMQHLEEATLWNDSMICDNHGALLVEAVRKLHQGGFVHGDLRSCNVLVCSREDKVLLIDFDWAGRVGEVRYPHFMNGNVEWPQGASDGELILQEHDLFWLRNCLSKSELRMEMWGNESKTCGSLKG